MKHMGGTGGTSMVVWEANISNSALSDLPGGFEVCKPRSEDCRKPRWSEVRDMYFSRTCFKSCATDRLRMNGLKTSAAGQLTKLPTGTIPQRTEFKCICINLWMWDGLKYNTFWAFGGLRDGLKYNTFYWAVWMVFVMTEYILLSVFSNPSFIKKFHWVVGGLRLYLLFETCLLSCFGANCYSKARYTVHLSGLPLY